MFHEFLLRGERVSYSSAIADLKDLLFQAFYSTPTKTVIKEGGFQDGDIAIMKCPNCSGRLKRLTDSAHTCMNCRVSFLEEHLE